MKRFWIPLWWLALAVFDATKTVEMMRAEGLAQNWPVLFAIEALGWLPWAFATWFIMWLAQRLRSVSRPVVWTVHIVNALFVDVIFAAWVTFLVLTFKPFGPTFHVTALGHFVTGVYTNLHVTIIFYALILAMASFLDSRDRLARQNVELAQLNEQLAQAQLSALRRQIEPHFLFNALNSAAGLIREARSSEAITMLVSLGDFL